MNAKDKHLDSMLSYWGDPNNKFISRAEMHREILKISGVAFYKHFSPSELLIIEDKASSIRKKNTSRQRSEVMIALHTEAVSGNVQAAKEYLDRTEGKVKEKVELTGKDGKDLNWTVKIVKPGDIECQK